MTNLSTQGFRLLTGLVVLVVLVATLRWSVPLVDAATASCTVISDSINVRQGPGTNYAVKSNLKRAAKVTPTAANADRSWIRIRVNGQDGWVNASLVKCDVGLSVLPTQIAPPTPTINPKATPVRAAIAYVDAPTQAGALELPGRMQVLATAVEKGHAVFRQTMVFRMAVSAVAGQADGSGVTAVKFSIFDDKGLLVYAHRDSAAPYCVFDNKTNACTVWGYSYSNYLWPASDAQETIKSVAVVEGINYTAIATVDFADGSTQNWQFNFEVVR